MPAPSASADRRQYIIVRSSISLGNPLHGTLPATLILTSSLTLPRSRPPYRIPPRRSPSSTYNSTSVHRGALKDLPAARTGRMGRAWLIVLVSAGSLFFIVELLIEWLAVSRRLQAPNPRQLRPQSAGE